MTRRHDARKEVAYAAGLCSCRFTLESDAMRGRSFVLNQVRAPANGHQFSTAFVRTSNGFAAMQCRYDPPQFRYASLRGHCRADSYFSNARRNAAADSSSTTFAARSTFPIVMKP